VHLEAGRYVRAPLDRDGALRTIVAMWRLRFAYWRGVDATRLARRYPAARPSRVTLQVFAKNPVPRPGQDPTRADDRRRGRGGTLLRSGRADALARQRRARRGRDRSHRALVCARQRRSDVRHLARSPPRRSQAADRSATSGRR
jgi:hypothetical protein